MNKTMDIIGIKFNRLTVLQLVGTDKYGNSKFLCKCDCGKTKVSLGSKVKGGRKKSCGCRYSSYCVDCKYRAFGLGLVEVE